MKAENKLITKETLLDLQIALRRSLFNRPFHIEDIESKALALCDAVVNLFEEPTKEEKPKWPIILKDE